MKQYIPYPLFLVAAVILDRVVISSTQIGPAESLRSLSVLIILTVATLFLIQHRVRDWHYTNFVVLMIAVMLLLFRYLYRLLKVQVPQRADGFAILLICILCIAYILIINKRVWNSFSNPARLSYYLSIIFMLLFGFQIVNLAKNFYTLVMTGTHSQTTAISALTEDIELQNGTKPDIYVIVLDGYGRQDVLRKIYGYDNSEFIAWLDERGFYVATETHSNYVQTPYTMASFWNFDYLPTWDSSSEYEQYLYQPIQNNRVFRLLDEIGYTTVSTEGAVHFTEIRNSDVYLSNFLPLNDFETLLLIDSPLEPLSNIVDLHLPLQTYKTHRDRFYYQLETLKKIPLEIKSPKTVYTHILLPHPPFIFDQAGQAREIVGSFSLAEGAEFQGGKEEYVSGYRAQVKIINGEIMKVVDAILTKSETAPVIVIMGDHGPASMFHFRVDDPGCIWERTSNLYAILLPGHKEDGTLYPSISPVNTFRVIFNTYFGTDLHLLEDRSYLRYWQQPTLNVDVTSIRDSRDHCTISGNQGK